VGCVTLPDPGLYLAHIVGIGIATMQLLSFKSPFRALNTQTRPSAFFSFLGLCDSAAPICPHIDLVTEANIPAIRGA
jgi:hypothetical protein